MCVHKSPCNLIVQHNNEKLGHRSSWAMATVVNRNIWCSPVEYFFEAFVFLIENQRTGVFQAFGEDENIVNKENTQTCHSSYLFQQNMRLKITIYLHFSQALLWSIMYNVYWRNPWKCRSILYTNALQSINWSSNVWSKIGYIAIAKPAKTRCFYAMSTANTKMQSFSTSHTPLGWFFLNVLLVGFGDHF